MAQHKMGRVKGAPAPAALVEEAEPLTPDGGTPEVSVIVEAPVTPRVQGKLAKSLCFYLRREQRRGWTLSDSDQQGLVDLAREVWHEALDEREAGE